jgi:hypothetical protein
MSSLFFSGLYHFIDNIKERHTACDAVVLNITLPDMSLSWFNLAD